MLSLQTCQQTQEFSYIVWRNSVPISSPCSPPNAHILWSFKSKSSEQAQLSRNLIGGVIEKCDAETAVIFTDG